VDALRDAGALPAMMSGSGSAVFGVFADPQSALQGIMAATQACPEESSRGIVVWTSQRVERVETQA
jgi:4-diphosphocytidyl-2C-methyl-D-erythritol kinase